MNIVRRPESQLGREVAISIFPNFSYQPDLHGRDYFVGLAENNPLGKDWWFNESEGRVSGA